MNRIRPLVVRFSVLALSLVLLGCDSLRTVNVDIESETLVESGGFLGSVFTQFGFDDFVSFDVSQSAEFKNNDATRGNIGESYVTGFVLEVISPQGNTLSFIDDLEIYIGDGSTKLQVAYIDESQDTDVSRLALKVFDESDIGKYLRAEATTVEVNAKGTPPSEDTQIRATLSLSIQLQL